MPTRTLSAAVAILVIAGCSDSGPVKIGQDTYTISTKVMASGAAGAKNQALQEANAYCTSLHKEIMLVSETMNECSFHGGCGEAEVHFMCLAANDPRYKPNDVTSTRQ
jgi:hypothetical protein